MESPAKYPTYNIDYLRQDFVKILDNFFDELCSVNFRDTIGKKLFKQIQLQKQNIVDSLDADFEVVVIGDFNRGKSTLINALLGEDIVTINELPETVTINRIQYGSELAIYINLTNGIQIPLDKEQLKSEELKQILAQQPYPVKDLSIQTPNELLKRGLCLVDTPGTGDIFKHFDPKIHTYLSKADLVIFVLSVPAPFSESEQEFLKISVIPQDFPKVLFILNSMDTIPKEQDVERLFNNTYKKISNLFPNPQLFAISAKDEFCRNQSLSRPNPAYASILEKGFDDFRKSLDDTMDLQRGLIQLDRSKVRMEQMLQQLKKNLLTLHQAMQIERNNLNDMIDKYEANASKLRTKIQNFIKEIKDEINQLREQAREWMEDFINYIDNEVIATIDNSNIEDVKKHFKLFLNESFRNAVFECVKYHRTNFIEICQKIKQEIDKDLENLVVDFNYYTKVDNEIVNSDEKSAININTLEILSEYHISKIVPDLIFKQKQNSTISNQDFHYKQKLRDALHEFKQNILEKISSLYNDTANKIEEEIEKAYEEKIKTFLTIMQLAQHTCIEEQQTVTNKTLQNTLLILDDARKSLKEFNKKLCYELCVE